MTEPDWIDSEELGILLWRLLMANHGTAQVDTAREDIKDFLREKRSADMSRSYGCGYCDGCPPTPNMELSEELKIMTKYFKRRENL